MPFYDRILQAIRIASHSSSKSQPPSSVYSPHISTERDLLARPIRKYGPAPKAIHGDVSLYSRQVGSPLFEKLPVELRDFIWELLLGHHTIHLFWHDRDTMRGFICPQQADGPRKCISMSHDANRAKELMWTSASHICESTIDQKKGFMPLLLTCRAVLVSSVPRVRFQCERCCYMPLTRKRQVL